jgi:hypothetical protein
MLKKQLIFLASFIAAVIFFAGSASMADDTTKVVAGTDSLKSHKTKISVFPYAFYNPEVKLAFGAGGIITFYTSDDQDLRPSKLSLSGYYSTSKQYNIGLSPQVYLFGDLMFISVKLFTQDKIIFTPDPDNPEVDSEVWGTETEIRLPALFGFNALETRRKLGIIFDYQHVDLSFDQENPAEDDPPHTLGLGLAWTLDSRDNIFFPTNGHLLRFKIAVFAKEFGSSYDFNRYELDLRHYFPIDRQKKQLIAAQFYTDIASGSPPFYRLPALGGSKIMRGYKKGSLRDRNYIAGQVEFRTHVWWRIGGVAFLGVGDVANEFNEFEVRDLQYSYGAGLRYTFNRDEGINLRADLGFGNNTNGIYISVEEAF